MAITIGPGWSIGPGWAVGEIGGGGGTQKAIFGYGENGASIYYSITNLVSNTGVVANDTAGVGTARQALAAASYG